MMNFISFNQLEVQSSLEYWTDERIANAIPALLPFVEIPKESQQNDDEFSQAEAEMFLWGFRDRRVHPVGAFRVNVNNDPYNKAGRLYFKSPDNKDNWATAQFVGADNILLTAAHCLKNLRGKWSQNIIFRRACRNIKYAQSMNVAVDRLGLHDAWGSVMTYPDRVKWDYGFARTTKNSTVGSLSLSTDLPEKLKAIGYTQNHGNEARYMYVAHGTSGPQINGVVNMNGNYMNHGASGGAWFERDDGQKVVGINATVNGLGTMNGPVFDSNTIDVLDRMMNPKKDS